MDVGRTNKRIIFCKYEEQENELLQKEQKLVQIKTVWASVEPMRGREYQEAQRIRQELTYKITTRYYPWITQDMYILFKKRCFEIISIINPREKNEMLLLICVEKVKKKQEMEHGPRNGI